MSLTVKHLNGDTTFLLTFSPNDSYPPSPPGLKPQQPPGTFTILIDPWLSGPTTMWHPKFLLSKHTVQSCISNLSHIPEPNVVLISQEKPDHCHEATLRQLDPTSPITTILAEPGAAKKIRGMKFFDPSMVHSLRPYSERKPDSVIRFFIPPMVIGGAPGEATISFIPARMDVAGVHNAIGITYRPPSSTCTASRPFSSTYQTSQLAFNQSSQQPPAPQNLPRTPPESPTRQTSVLSNTTCNFSSNASTASTASTAQSQQSKNFSHHNLSISSKSSVSSSYGTHTEKALSLIYSPHGVDYSLIRAYASSHLVATAALPLTLLLHSFDRVNNPWWMGGNLAAGLLGGVEIAQNLMARCWISAHDEEKENSGLSVLPVKIRKYTKDEVRDMLRQERASNVDVAVLPVGCEMVLKA
ncbi:hypothetical protein MMC28_011384 [Mycoblastus sanguinarius]|nr:hypothetical protein [Mycoblastus sanguinarius]